MFNTGRDTFPQCEMWQLPDDFSGYEAQQVLGTSMFLLQQSCSGNWRRFWRYMCYIYTHISVVIHTDAVRKATVQASIETKPLQLLF